MPRKPRMYLPGYPAHVIQRGNNRSVCFFTTTDFSIYLDCLGDACRRYRVALHAYVLMTNHVHLLLTPEYEEGISRVIQSLGRRYVQYINNTYRRTGTLWEGRHKSSLVDRDNYLLTCQRYIELNPVRAGMVKHPGDYPWSSYRANAYGERNDYLSRHPSYLQLGTDERHVQQTYRELFAESVNRNEIHQIRQAAQMSMPLGNDKFRLQVERAARQRALLGT